MLRDHYESGEMPVLAAPAGSAKSFSLCMHGIQATTASMVAELSEPQSGAPVVMWACLGAPCTGVYFPLYPDAILPPALGVGGERPSHKSPWWRMKEIQDKVARAPERFAPMVWKHLRPLENAMLEQAAELAQRVRNLRGEHRRATLSRFMAQNLVHMTRELGKVEAALSGAT